MEKRQSNTGYISLYDVDMDFVIGKKYNTILEREKILTYWKKLYKLSGKKYSLIIRPDINLKLNDK